MTLYGALYLPIKKKRQLLGVSVTQRHSGYSTNDLKRCKSAGIKCQQVNPKRLPSDHDPEADSERDRGDKLKIA